MSKPERKELKGTVTAVYINDAATVMKLTVNNETLVLFQPKIEMYQRITEGDYLIVKECNYGPNTHKGKTTYQYTLADWDTIEVKNELDPGNGTNPTDSQLEQDEFRASEGSVNYTNTAGYTGVFRASDLIGTGPKPQKANHLIKDMVIGIELTKNYQKTTLSATLQMEQVSSDTEWQDVYNEAWNQMYEQVRKKIETVAHDMR